MLRKKAKKVKLSPKKMLAFLVVGVIAVAVIAFTQHSTMSADSTSLTVQNNCSLTQRIASGQLFNCPARGSRLVSEVEQPFPNSNLSAFPDGQSCAYVDLEAIKSDGTFLQNEPLVVVKPTAVNINGTLNTGSGTNKLCFTTSRAMQARVIIKLQNLPQVNTTFTLNFNPKYKIQDATDRQSFLFNEPITFVTQIDPSMVPGLTKKTLSYTYTRRVNVWGIWRNQIRRINKEMTCSDDGRCTAVISGTDVATNRVVNGRFTYTYNFTAQGNRKFYQSYSGQLHR